MSRKRNARFCDKRKRSILSIDTRRNEMDPVLCCTRNQGTFHTLYKQNRLTSQTRLPGWPLLRRGYLRSDNDMASRIP